MPKKKQKGSVRLPGTPLSWLDNEIAKAERAEFSFRCDESRKSGRYPFDVAANLIARAAGVSVSAAKMEERLIFAARDRSLPAYELEQTVRWDGDMPFVSCIEIHWDDLNKWLKNNEPRLDCEFPNPNTLTAAKVDAVKPSITKQQAINAFEGLHFTDRNGWNNALSDVPKWIEPCRVTPGRKGDNSTPATWNPVLIAVALFDKGVPIKKLDTVFVGLKDWAKDWQEKSASFRP